MNYKMIKFKLTDEKMSNQLELDAYRIVALRDFGDVKAGDLGGFVEFESNLSHDGDCWIGEHGVVVHRCKVQGNAKIDYAELYNGCSIKILSKPPSLRVLIYLFIFIGFHSP